MARRGATTVPRVASQIRTMATTEAHLLEAIALARDNVRAGGRPFGAGVVKDGRVIARGVNEMGARNDPTAHAELLALREAGRALGTPRLDGCEVFASGQPCPMCLAACHMSGVVRVAFACSNEEGEPYGLSTARVYAEMARPIAEQSIAIAHVRVRPDGGADLYELHRARSARS